MGRRAVRRHARGRRFDRWTEDISYRINEEGAEILRRRKSYLMLITNVPDRDRDPEHGLSDEDLVRMYASEWRVEWNFKGKKRPIMVERLFMKDVGRAEALITIVNIAARAGYGPAPHEEGCGRDG